MDTPHPLHALRVLVAATAGSSTRYRPVDPEDAAYSTGRPAGELQRTCPPDWRAGCADWFAVMVDDLSVAGRCTLQC